MRRVWWWTVAVLAMAVAGVNQAKAEDEVDCSTLEYIQIGSPESYDEVFCYAVTRSGLAATGSERRIPVGGDTDLIVAFNRATFALVRFDGTNNRTYLPLESVEQTVGAPWTGWNRATGARSVSVAGSCWPTWKPR